MPVAKLAVHPRSPLLNALYLAVPVVAMLALTMFEPIAGLVLLAVAVLAVSGLVARNPIAIPAAFVLALFMVAPRYTFVGFGAARLVSLVALALWLLSRLLKTDSGRRITRTGRAVLLFWCACLVSFSIGALAPIEAVEQARGDRFFVSLAGLCGLALLMSDTIRDAITIRRLLACFVFGATVMSSLALLEAAAGIDVVSSLRPPGFSTAEQVEKTSYRLGVFRAEGTASHPIEQGVMAATALPLALYLAARARKGGLLAYAAVGILSLGVLVSVSRSAILCVALAVLLLVPTWDSTRRRRFVALAALLVVGVATLLPQFANALSETLGDFSGSSVQGANVDARTEDYGPAFEIILKSPLVGRGYGTFDPALHFFTDNQVLKSLIETGILGVLALVGMIVTALMACVRTRHRSEDSEVREVAWSVFVSLAVLTVSFVFFDTLSFSLASGGFFFLLGIAGSLEQLTRDRSADTHGDPALFDAPEIRS